MKLVIDHDDLHQQYNDYKINPSQGHSISKRYSQKELNKQNSHDEEEEYNELIGSIRISPETFMKLCPALLVQIDQDACAQRLVVDNDHINVEGYTYCKYKKII